MHFVFDDIKKRFFISLVSWTDNKENFSPKNVRLIQKLNHFNKYIQESNIHFEFTIIYSWVSLNKIVLSIIIYMKNHCYAHPPNNKMATYVSRQIPPRTHICLLPRIRPLLNKIHYITQ